MYNEMNRDRLYLTHICQFVSLGDNHDFKAEWQHSNSQPHVKMTLWLHLQWHLHFKDILLLIMHDNYVMSSPHIRLQLKFLSNG